MRAAVTGVDIGTASARAAVFDHCGHRLGYGSCPIRMYIGEQSSSGIWSGSAPFVRQGRRHGFSALRNSTPPAPRRERLYYGPVPAFGPGPGDPPGPKASFCPPCTGGSLSDAGLSWLHAPHASKSTMVAIDADILIQILPGIGQPASYDDLPCKGAKIALVGNTRIPRAFRTNSYNSFVDHGLTSETMVV